MITASFNPENNNRAMVSGAVQYDTGQRVRLVGLPSPQALGEMDEFLSGDTVTVEVQYGRRSDSQTESRLAQWDSTDQCWYALVPDIYLTKSEEVHGYVYVNYGTETPEDPEETPQSRSKTTYIFVFTPTSRPAPANQVTPAQYNAWDVLVAEINAAISACATATGNANAATTSSNEQTALCNTATANANTAATYAQTTADTAAATANASAANADAKATAAQTAADNANTATSNANTATSNANSATTAANNAATAANTAATNVGQATVVTNTLAAGSNASVTVDRSVSPYKFTFGIPRGNTGATGPQGPKGDTGATGPAGVTFTLSGTTLYIVRS